MEKDEQFYLKQLVKLTELIAGGNYDKVNTLLSMTTGSDTPPKVMALAEAFSLMVVQLEAREWHLEMLVQDLVSANLTTLELLGAAISKRDSDTSAHNYRVTVYAVLLAEAVGLGDDTVRALIKGAMLHDLGKIAIPDHILLKPGKLTEEEFAVMRTHVQHGVDIVKKSAWLEDAVDVVRYHHEKYDGKGYLRGLAGEDIPITARIFAIVDVFDALTSRRPYKEPMSVERSLAIINQGTANHFDPALVDVFVGLAPGAYEKLARMEEEELVQYMRDMVNAYFEDAA